MGRKIKTAGNVQLVEKGIVPEKEVVLTETEIAIKEAKEQKEKREDVYVDFVFVLNYFDNGVMYSAGEIVQLKKSVAEKYKKLGFGG